MGYLNMGATHPSPTGELPGIVRCALSHTDYEPVDLLYWSIDEVDRGLYRVNLQIAEPDGAMLIPVVVNQDVLRRFQARLRNGDGMRLVDPNEPALPGDDSAPWVGLLIALVLAAAAVVLIVLEVS